MTASCTICRAEFQHMYDTAGTLRDLEKLVGISRSKLHIYGKALRIKMQRRGGSYGRTGADRVSHWLANKENGDGALRARPCKRLPCPHGVMSGKVLRQCSMSEDGECEACKDSYNVALGVQGTSLEQCREMGVESAAATARMPVARKRAQA